MVWAWVLGGNMNHKEIVIQLQSQSTWFLLFINLITLGLYSAHYMIRQTKIINSHLDKKNKLSIYFVFLIALLKYSSVFIVFVELTTFTTLKLASAAFLIDLLVHLIVIAWCVKARNRMNHILNVPPGHFAWFSLLWSIVFRYLYFNYKVNCTDQALIEQYATSTSSTT